MKAYIQVLLAFLLAIVSRVANELWDQVWARVFDAIAHAEAKWVAEGSGKVKRDWVVAQIMAFIDEKLKDAGKPLVWIDKWITSLAVGAIVDGIIGALNDTLGKDWRKKAEELEQTLNEKLSFIN